MTERIVHIDPQRDEPSRQTGAVLRSSLAMRRLLGVAAVWALGLLSAAPFDGWSRRRTLPSGAGSARLHLRSLLSGSAGRFIERSGTDRFTLWMFGLPVHVSRSDALLDVQLPNGLIVRGRPASLDRSYCFGLRRPSSTTLDWYRLGVRPGTDPLNCRDSCRAPSGAVTVCGSRRGRCLSAAIRSRPLAANGPCPLTAISPLSVPVNDGPAALSDRPRPALEGRGYTGNRPRDMGRSAMIEMPVPGRDGGRQPTADMCTAGNL